MSSDADATRARQTIVGDYVLGRKLGSGGFGSVYEARHRQTLLAYAIKRIQLTDEDAERFEKEALYPARIASGSIHVMGVHSFFRDQNEGYFYLVTELVQHGDLRDFLDRNPKPLPLKQALELTLGIARGLAAIHEQNIIHRDLKPRNILIDRKDGRWIPKIADFGLSRSTASVSVGEFASAGYAAPEQMDLGAERAPGAEADLFSFGLIFYELLVGERASSATDIREYSRWLKERRIPPPPTSKRPEVPSEFDALVAGLLEFDPEMRKLSAADVVRMLETGLRAFERRAEQPQPAGPFPPIEPPTQPRPDKKAASVAGPVQPLVAASSSGARRWVVLFLVVAGLALILGTTWTVLKSGSESSSVEQTTDESGQVGANPAPGVPDGSGGSSSPAPPADQTAAFALPPLVSGTWLGVNDADRDRLVRQLSNIPKMQDSESVGRITRMRGSEAPFYASTRLIEAETTTSEGKAAILTFLDGPSGITFINGNAMPIHALNKAAPVLLDTQARAEAYIRFFCAAIGGEEPFFIVERPEDLAFTNSALPLDARISGRLKPLTIELSGSFWQGTATMLFEKMLSSVKLRVPLAGANIGLVEILQDTPLESEIPIKTTMFKGNLRVWG